MEKFSNVLSLGMKVIVAISAGWFVHRMLEDKADELIQDGGMINAFAIGCGETAIVLTAATLAFHIAG